MAKMSPGGAAGQDYLGNLRLLRAPNRSIRKWNTEHWAKQA